MNIEHRTSNIEHRTARPEPGSRFEVRGSRFNVRREQQGVALIITLILLSVITFMAIAFLAVSRRERASVTTVADQTTTRHLLESALDRAKVDMLADMLASGSLENYSLRVSTNFYNPLGFNPNPPAGGNRFTNVNYDSVGGNPNTWLNNLGAQQNIANLLYDPRPPVVVTLPNGLTDFRFYLDLNRNGRFDPNSALLKGDPEWIGILNRPGLPHSADNLFVGRIAFLVLPVGHGLDLNSIHNEVSSPFVAALPDDPDVGTGYRRNQGVGTWEDNLAALLADLNTNYWGQPGLGYVFNPPAVRGFAFEDAAKLLRHRYTVGTPPIGNYSALAPFGALYPGAGPKYARDMFDGYGSGPFWTTVTAPTADPDALLANIGRPWPGAENPNAFFSPQQLFDTNVVGTLFASRLLAAGTNADTYNAPTFYRLLDAVGVSSEPERGKLNVNYDNRVQTNAFSGQVAATNFLPWKPIDFFTNAAASLLAELNLQDTNGNDISITNIPLWPNNYYTPAVHRALQVAANIYDATTNRTDLSSYPYLPHVFRPQYGRSGTNVFISGYVEQTSAAGFMARSIRNLNDAASRSAIAKDDSVMGVPLVIGAKKGLPNFNEDRLQNFVQLTRKLELRKPAAGLPPSQTNQMFQMSVSNVFAMELWNAYSTAYPRDLDVTYACDVTMLITNDTAATPVITNRLVFARSVPYAANTWAGFNPQGSQTAQQASFRVPLITNVFNLPESTYSARLQKFVPLTSSYESGMGFPIPQWRMTVTNNVRFFLVDRATDRIVDYVTLAGASAFLDITRQVMGNVDISGEPSVVGQMWMTNRVGGPASQNNVSIPPQGVINQIEVSLGNRGTSDQEWKSYNADLASGQDKQKAVALFRVFLGLSPAVLPAEIAVQSSIARQAPFTPTRKMYQFVSWQANDPLVHYALSDLQDLARTNDIKFITPPSGPHPDIYVDEDLAKINPRYHPWGGRPGTTPQPEDWDVARNDPLVLSPNDWDFPTNKLPNVGWLGRIHRGTPWQTIYLKSPDLDAKAWREWSGNDVQVRSGKNLNLVTDSDLTRPVRDRDLFSIFTAAPNDNATLGQLSVNQTNLAAWSAVLSGVIVLSNSAANPASAAKYQPVIIEPALSDPNAALLKIVNGIKRTRNDTNLFRAREFRKKGDILAVPELTVASPFLNTNGTSQLHYGIADSAYERIPQQVMGLLRYGQTRFVIFVYAQALRPADHSTVQGGPFAQMCINYQVAGEAAARAVVRVEGSINRPQMIVESFNLLPPD